MERVTWIVIAKRRNRMFKKVITSVLSVLLVFTAIVIPSAGEANAEWNVKTLKYRKNVTVYKFPGSELPDDDSSVYGIDLGKRDNKAKKVTFTSSKKGVISKPSWTGSYAVFTAKKTGKTVLTIKVKNKNGSIKKYKVNVTVKKYVSPVKSLKIGKTELRKKMGKDLYLTYKYANSKAKFSITPKKGWKVSKLNYNAWYEGEDEELMEKGDIDKNFKNNAIITFRNAEDYSEWISFTMTEKATGLELEYQIDLIRK